MPLEAGRSLGPYEIVAPLGAGGMGEVYEARDTRLGRTVAIKVLPAWLAQHADRRARFEREARTVSQLSHPHVCALHDIGEENGIHFLVLEHCQGETLAARLERGPLPLGEVLRFGAEIGEALDAAHRRGVIHRDLKPANVMLTASGVKLLDFGLARIAAGGGENRGDLPTISLEPNRPLTDEGTVLGTYPYMAPEQVEGREADARSDIFAFGAVLHEMTTGRRAFDGESAASIMAAVLREEPEPLSRLEPLSPAALDHVVSRCLVKDPEERWQSARDVAGELRWVAGRVGRDGEDAAAAARAPRRWTGWAVAGLLAVLAGILAWPAAEEPERRAIPETVAFSFRLPDGLQLQQATFTGSPVEVAPDGSFLVFGARPEEGEPGVFRRSIDSVEIGFVEGTEGGRQPFVSPDSRWIGFFTENGGLARVPAEGGLRQRIFDGERLLPTGAAWGPDGRIYFARGLTGGLGAASASGGGFQDLTTPDPEAGEIGHWYPRPLPEGRGLLFGAWTVEGWRNFVLDLESRALHPLGARGRREGAEPAGRPPMSFGGHPHYVDSGHLVLLDGENLIAVPFDAESRRLLGDPVTVLSDVASFHVSWAGTLVYLDSSVVRADGEATRWSPRTGEPVSLGGPAKGGQLRLSPDGSRLAIADTPHLWLVELDRGVRTRLTAGGVVNNFPVWSPDGTRVLFNSLRAPHGLYVRSADRLGEARLVVKRTEEVVFLPASWSPDGTSVALTELHPDGGADIAVADIETGVIESVADSPAREHSPAFSPDGRWLAYASDESGRDEVYLRPYRQEGRRITISTRGGTDPRWSADGRHLLFRSGSVVYDVGVDLRASEIVPGAPRRLAELPSFLESYVPFGPTWEVAPNGDLFYLRAPSEVAEPEIFVVSGWSRSLPGR